MQIIFFDPTNQSWFRGRAGRRAEGRGGGRGDHIDSASGPLSHSLASAVLFHAWVAYYRAEGITRCPSHALALRVSSCACVSSLSSSRYGGRGRGGDGRGKQRSLFWKVVKSLWLSVTLWVEDVVWFNAQWLPPFSVAVIESIWLYVNVFCIVFGSGLKAVCGCQRGGYDSSSDIF